MKLLIASDIHGSLYWCDRLLEAIAAEKPSQILLLGDLLYHGPRNALPLDYNPRTVADKLNALAAQGNVVCVRGNCEAEVDQMLLRFPVMADNTQLVDETGRILFATHGHMSTPDDLPYLPDGAAFVYGHTHVKRNEVVEGTLPQSHITLFNPGSVSIPKDGSHSYGIYEQGQFRHVEMKPSTLAEIDSIACIETAKGQQNLSAAPVEAAHQFQRLTNIIWRLRQDDGCPWDRVQTHSSIAKNMIEEAYEAVDCIEKDDVAHLREELGDCLMQIMLHAQISADEGNYSIAEIISDLNDKLIRRHPHVFGEQSAQDAHEVLQIWDSVKLDEQAKKHDDSLLDSVPSNFPALLQAQKISRKVASVGFDWPDAAQVWQKVGEEYAEFVAEDKGSRERELEFGDILFSLVNVARKEHIDAENALRAATAKFRARWEYMERTAAQQQLDITKLSTQELEALWQEAKQSLAQ